MTLRFSIGSLLVAALVASIECAVLFGLRDSDFLPISIVGIACLFFAFLVGSIAYDRAHARAFAFGAMAPLFMMAWIGDLELYSHPIHFQFALKSLIVVATGLVTLSMFHFSQVKYGQSVSQPTRAGFSTLLSGIIVGLVLGGAVIITVYFVEPPSEPPPNDNPWRTHGGII